MKNASMNRKITVSVIGMMLLVLGILGILLTSLLLVGCGGAEETDSAVSPASADDKKELLPVVGVPLEPPPLPEPPAQQQPEPEPPALPEPPPPALNDLGACAAGMMLKPGESCGYVAGRAKVVFSVRQDGSACREGGPVEKVQVIFGAKVNVNIENQNICVNDDIAQDDAFNSNLAASKNADGSWTINRVP